MGRKGLRIAGVVLCVVAPLTYFGGLHPATGLIGGLVFLPTGWILADLFWVGLGLLAASFLPGGALLKTAIVIAVYVLSAVPVALIKTSAAQPRIEVLSVENSPQRLTRDEPITIVTRLQPREFAVGRNLPREIGGDEGCMCLYFRTAPTITQFFQSRLKWETTRGLSDSPSASLDVLGLDAGPILQLIDGDDGYDIRLVRLEQHRETSRHVFRVQGLAPDLRQTYRREDGLRHEFWPQAGLNFAFSPWPAKLANRVFLTPIESELQTRVLGQAF